MELVVEKPNVLSAVEVANVCADDVAPLSDAMPPPPLPQLRPVDVTMPPEISRHPLARPRRSEPPIFALPLVVSAVMLVVASVVVPEKTFVFVNVFAENVFVIVVEAVMNAFVSASV